MKVSTLKIVILAALYGLFLCSLFLLTWNTWQLVTSRGGQFLIDRTQTELTVALKSLTSRNISQERLEEKLNDGVEASPRDWIVIQSLRDVATREGYDLSKGLSEKLEAAYDTDHSLRKSAIDCFRCVRNSSDCDLSYALACGIAVDLSPVGDLAGIFRAGIAYSRGKTIDRIDAALSVLGLGATTLSISTGGSSLSVKVGVSLLRFAHLSGRIPASITQVLQRSAADGINWAKLPDVRSVDDLATVIQKDALLPAIDVAKSLGKIVAKTDMQQGFYLLNSAEGAAELRQISNLSEVLEERTAGYIALLGKNKILRATMRISDEVYGLVLGLLGAFFSLLYIMSSTLFNALNRRLRKWVRNTV